MGGREGGRESSFLTRSSVLTRDVRFRPFVAPPPLDINDIASIARNMAYIAYEDAYSSREATRAGSSYRRRYAVDLAQRVERKSIDAADLSVQELVDCDTRYDQGCAGGNPLLAFYFLHRFGATSASNYPYTGKMDTCKYRKVDEPVATVKSWGILTADHENNIEKVRRFLCTFFCGAFFFTYFPVWNYSCNSDFWVLCVPSLTLPPPPAHRHLVGSAIYWSGCCRIDRRRSGVSFVRIGGVR